MQLLGKLEIKSPEKVAEFLNEEHVGRIATVDSDGYPQVIPMNFAYVDGRIYMHSHIRGQKLDNLRANPKAGFEVDRELEFLPSYFEDPKDASLADTLYISVVAKGTAETVEGKAEKAMALNALMKKYQPEGRYEPVRQEDGVLGHVAVIRFEPKSLRGKYKVGQSLGPEERAALAEKILHRRPGAADTLRAMGFEVRGGRPVMTSEPDW